MSHVLLECPVVQPAVAWLRDLWAKLGDALPPLDAQVLVVGDRTVWSPGGGDVWELWTHLRLEFCRAVWRLTARRASTGTGLHSNFSGGDGGGGAGAVYLPGLLGKGGRWARQQRGGQESALGVRGLQ